MLLYGNLVKHESENFESPRINSNLMELKIEIKKNVIK